MVAVTILAVTWTETGLAAVLVAALGGGFKLIDKLFDFWAAKPKKNTGKVDQLSSEGVMQAEVEFRNTLIEQMRYQEGQIATMRNEIKDLNSELLSLKQTIMHQQHFEKDNEVLRAQNQHYVSEITSLRQRITTQGG